jgi:hypothetical protein
MHLERERLVSAQFRNESFGVTAARNEGLKVKRNHLEAM